MLLLRDEWMKLKHIFTIKKQPCMEIMFILFLMMLATRKPQLWPYYQLWTLPSRVYSLILVFIHAFSNCLVPTMYRHGLRCEGHNSKQHRHNPWSSAIYILVGKKIVANREVGYKAFQSVMDIGEGNKAEKWIGSMWSLVKGLREDNT